MFQMKIMSTQYIRGLSFSSYSASNGEFVIDVKGIQSLERCLLRSLVSVHVIADVISASASTSASASAERVAGRKRVHSLKTVEAEGAAYSCVSGNVAKSLGAKEIGLRKTGVAPCGEHLV